MPAFIDVSCPKCGRKFGWFGEHIQHLIAKLQAQLVTAKDESTFNAGIAGDALMDRGLPRLEEVRRETAEKCIEIIRRNASGITAGGMVEDIHRHFVLTKEGVRTP